MAKNVNKNRITVTAQSDIETVEMDLIASSEQANEPAPAAPKYTLQVKRLDPRAILPTVAHPGEDSGYDLYAITDTIINPNVHTVVHTGVVLFQEGHGLIVKDRSSMASKGLFTVAGVVDAGYRGELVVMLASNRFDRYSIKAGEKIAQVVPVPILTGEIVEVEELPESSRGHNGFGSSGK